MAHFNKRKWNTKMVLILTPEIATITSANAVENEKITIPQPSKIEMKQQIHGAIIEFLVNPAQCCGEHWNVKRFDCRNGDDQIEYIHQMARGIQDWACDIYDFNHVNTNKPIDYGSTIYDIVSPALKNAIDVFGIYAIEQHAMCVFAALMAIIEPAAVI